MIERFASDSPFEEAIGYSRVVRNDDLYVTAGCTSVVGGQLVHEGDPYEQTRTAFEVGLRALEQAGCPRQNVIQTRMYVTDRAYAGEVGRAHHDVFAAIRPVTAMIVVAGFIDERMLVEVELVGVAP